MDSLLPFGVLVFVFWCAAAVVPACLAAPVARARGRDAAAWFVIVLVSGWLGLLVLLMFGGSDVRVERRRRMPRRHRGKR